MIHSNQCSNRTGSTGSHSTSQWKIFFECYFNSVFAVNGSQKLKNSNPCSVLIGVQRKPPVVSNNLFYNDTWFFRQFHLNFITGLLDRKTEYIESTRDVRNSRRCYGLHAFHISAHNDRFELCLQKHQRRLQWPLLRARVLP